MTKCQSLKTREIPGDAQTGNFQPEQYTLESYVNSEQLMSPPEQYPIPGADDHTSPFNYGNVSVEENKEFLVVTRNSLDLLSSILNSGPEPTLVKVSNSFLCVILCH